MTKAALNRNKRKADTSNAAIDRLKREVCKSAIRESTY